MERIAEIVFGIIEGLFAEASIMLLLVGLVLFAIGAALIAAGIYIRMIAYRTTGRVVGAVQTERVKTRQRDGKEVHEVKKSLFAVFEYQRADGTTHRERASEGGSDVHKYKTGQSVNLLIVRWNNYDNVYDADKKAIFVMGAIFAGLGVFLMAQAATIVTSFGIGLFSLLLVGTSLAVRAFRHRRGWIKPKANRGRMFGEFNPEDVRPVEEFARA